MLHRLEDVVDRHHSEQMAAVIDHRHCHEPVALNELGDVLAVGLRPDCHRSGDHHLVEPGAGPGEDQLPKRDHADQSLSHIHDVDVVEVVDVLMQAAQRFDRLAGRHAAGKACRFHRHEAAGGVCGKPEHLEDLVDRVVLQGLEDVGAGVRLQLADDVGGLVRRQLEHHGGRLGRRNLLEHIGGGFVVHLLEQISGPGRLQLRDEVGSCLLVDRLENVGGVVGIGLDQGVPLRFVCVEVFLGFPGAAPGQIAQGDRKFAGTV